MAKIDEEKYRVTPEIAEYVKQRRLALGWSRRFLADRVGCQPKYIYALEVRSRPRHPLLPTILQVLAGQEPDPPTAITPEVVEYVKRKWKELNLRGRDISRALGSGEGLPYRIVNKSIESSIYTAALLETLAEMEPRPHYTSKTKATPEIITHIRQERQAQGLSVAQLADRVGCSGAVIRRLEAGSTAASYYLQAILDVLAGKNPEPVKIRRKKCQRTGEFRKPPPPPGVAGHCERCQSLLFDDTELIPAGWPRENHIRVKSYCLECWLARNGHMNPDDDRPGLLSQCFSVLAEAR